MGEEVFCAGRHHELLGVAHPRRWPTAHVVSEGREPLRPVHDVVELLEGVEWDAVEAAVLKCAQCTTRVCDDHLGKEG